MKKTRFFKNFLKLVLLVTLAVLVGIFFAKKQKLSEKTQVNLVKPSPTQERITVSGVMMNDFYKFSPYKSEEYVTISKTKDYHIFYLRKQELFYISVTYPPFDENRQKAEEEFLKKLDISQESACKLNVDITTPGFVNPDKAGEVYKLSFCEN